MKLVAKQPSLPLAKKCIGVLAVEGLEASLMSLPFVSVESESL